MNPNTLPPCKYDNDYLCHRPSFACTGCHTASLTRSRWVRFARTRFVEEGDLWREVACVVSPGLILRKELKARGWTQRHLAQLMRTDDGTISRILSGKGPITVRTALKLEEILGASAEFWLDLEYRVEVEAGEGEQMSKRGLDYYLALRYTITLFPDEENTGYYAEIPALKGCLAFRETAKEALDTLEIIKRVWLESALESGWEIPEPVYEGARGCC